MKNWIIFLTFIWGPPLANYMVNKPVQSTPPKYYYTVEMERDTTSRYIYEFDYTVKYSMLFTDKKKAVDYLMKARYNNQDLKNLTLKIENQ